MTRPKQGASGSTGHTPGPWEIWSDMWFGRGDQAVGRVFPNRRENRDANAHRIVECVNACEGFADPSAVKELLEAAKEARDALLVHGPMAETERLDRDFWESLLDFEAFDALRAAISKATGTNNIAVMPQSDLTSSKETQNTRSRK